MEISDPRKNFENAQYVLCAVYTALFTQICVNTQPNEHDVCTDPHYKTDFWDNTDTHDVKDISALRP